MYEQRADDAATLRRLNPFLLVAALGAAGCAGPTMSTSLRPAHTMLAEADAPKLRVTVDEAAHEVVLDMGPFSVPTVGPASHAHHEAESGAGAEMAAAHGVEGPLMTFEWPIDGWMQGFQVRITDASGTEIPRDVLHHLIGVNFDRRQLAYPAFERFFGVGAETGDVALPSSLGVPMGEGQRLGVYASLHNDTGRDLDRVYVRIAMDYARRTESRVTDVLPAYFDTDNEVGGDNTWDLRPGRTERAWEFTVPVSGGLLGVSGHLHDYGEHVRLEDAETGEVLVRLSARKDDDGHVTSVSTHLFRKFLGLRSDPLRLEAGHRYRVVGVYENPLGQTIVDGAMAHVVGIFAPDDMSQWPALDPEDESVQLDLAALPAPQLDPEVSGAPRRH